MAIAAAWNTVVTSVVGSTALYTTATSGYLRDLVITNNGPSTLFVGLGTGLTAAATTSSFQVPAGGTVLLTECQVPNSGIIYGISAGTSATSIGYGSLVSYV